MNSCTSELSERAKTWNENLKWNLLVPVWDCGSVRGLKCFLLRNVLK